MDSNIIFWPLATMIGLYLWSFAVRLGIRKYHRRKEIQTFISTLKTEGIWDHVDSAVIEGKIIK